MLEFLRFYSFPLICVTVVAVCWLGICLLTAKQNGGTLTKDDARYTFGCLIHCGRTIIAFSLFFVVIKFSNEVLPPYVPDPMQRGLTVVVILIAIGGLGVWFTGKVLARWPLYRKMRYLAHWNFDRKRSNPWRLPKWGQHDNDNRENGS